MRVEYCPIMAREIPIAVIAEQRASARILANMLKIKDIRMLQFAAQSVPERRAGY